MISDDQLDPARSALAALVRQALPPPLSDARRRAGRARLLAAIERRPVRRGWRWLAAAAAVATLLGTGAVLQQRHGVSALAYQLEGAELEGPYIRAAGPGPVLLRFSDATTVVAEKEARLRVEGTTVNGGRVLIERGRTRVHVIHRDHADWTFLAGPFEVRVVGTRFELAWDPEHEALDLETREGVVEVKTPFATGPLRVSAGHHFHGDVGRRSVTLSDGSNRVPHAMSSVVPSAQASALPSSAAATEAPRANEPSNKPFASTNDGLHPSWTRRVADGQFAAVLAEANARGVDACLKHCSASDLMALADAARYSAQSALAERGLSALRSRFRTSAEGRTAAFTLGRLHERAKESAAALSAYDAYLSEAPNGNLAAEALAGKLRIVLATEGKRAAAPIAEAYLRRYPNGVQAELAREVLGTH